MQIKYTALPIILALAAGGCSSPQTSYPNFKACYNDTKDANKCIDYIESRSFDGSTQTTPAPVSNDSGIDGSSALTGAAVGAAAGYMLGNNNNRNTSSTVEQERKKRPTPVVASNAVRPEPSRNSKPSLTKSSKSSTTRGGWGSSSSKSFGG